LKRNSIKGDLLLVECEPLGDAMDALKNAPGVMDAAVFGNALHLVVENASTTEPQVQAYLSQKGVRLDRIAPIRPTLEDAFVSLTTSRSAEEHNR
jgi:ABC-2 type transport system ATP-binding protein